MTAQRPQATVAGFGVGAYDRRHANTGPLDRAFTPMLSLGQTGEQDRPDSSPLYRVVKQAICRRIRSGELPPGARVPSEHEIVREYGVSRMTANRALRELMAEGVVTRVNGVGSFVARPTIRGEMLEIRNIADEIAARGNVHRCQLIACAAVTAPVAVAEALERPVGTRVLHTLMVHLEGDTPIQIEDRYVNPEIAPAYLDVDFQSETANSYLSRLAPITGFEHVIEAILPDANARRLLMLRPKQPCLRLFRRTWSEGVPVTCAWLTYSAALYSVRVGSAGADSARAAKNFLSSG